MKLLNSFKHFSKSFHLLTASQFLGVLNDNLFKFLVVFQLISIKGTEHVVSVSALAGLVYVIPFLIGSPIGGYLADRFSKQKVLHFFNIVEIGVMGLGVVGFAIANPGLLYGSLFLMALQSALFGPSKSGIVPELVSREQLTKANGIQVGVTYLAIIIGTAAASLVSFATESNYTIASVSSVVIAALGAVCSRYIKSTKPQNADTKTSQFKKAFTQIKSNAVLRRALLGSMAFLFIGAFVQIQIIPFGMQILNLTRETSAFLFLAAALGIGIGAAVAGTLSKSHPATALSPLGACGIAVSLLLAGTWATTPLATAAVLFGMGFFAGLFIVIMRSLILIHSKSDSRGSVLSLSSVMDFASVLLASGLALLLDKSGITPQTSFTIIAIVTAVIALITFWCTFKQMLSLLPKALIRIRYNLKTKGIHNIPVNTGALLVFNHTSWIDALLAITASPRPIRFLMERRLYDKWFLNPLMKIMGIIPVSLHDGPKAMIRSLKKAQDALNNGDIVGIFPEGKIVVDGFLGEFKGGYTQIVKNTAAPIIPCHIDGAWGSAFSYYGGKLFSRGVHIFSRRTIQVQFGTPVENTVSPEKLKELVSELAVQNASDMIDSKSSLAKAVIQATRSSWNQTALTDTTGKSLTGGKTLIASLILSKKIKKLAADQKMVGILLPASAGGALVNVGCALAGKVSVNLNFTSSENAFSSAIDQCGLSTIISSKKFVAKLDRKDLPKEKIIFIEDILQSVSTVDKIISLVQARVYPVTMIAPKVSSSKECATIIFSSGSTAEPKGIVLSHRNILANVTAVKKGMAVSGADGICSGLPFFHSFGYTATIWLPLLAGFRAMYHPNPLDGAGIAQAVNQDKSTILLATPTFLTAYMRKASKEDFASLRLVVVGAEKLKKELADTFTQKFGVEPMEGYGATELSPVVSFNVPNTAVNGDTSPRAKRGTIGRALTGICVKIVDPDTGNEISGNQSGLLLVKGANVMEGYLNRPDLTMEAIRDEWYVTGDIASIDTQGFITLTDRLSRFSKIGGEMIPHGAIDEAVQSGLDSEDTIAVTTAIPDQRRGEKLIIVYNETVVSEELLEETIKRSALPNLWRPSTFIGVSEIPLLGSGKLDLKAIKNFALVSSKEVVSA